MQILCRRKGGQHGELGLMGQLQAPGAGEGGDDKGPCSLSPLPCTCTPVRGRDAGGGEV